MLLRFIKKRTNVTFPMVDCRTDRCSDGVLSSHRVGNGVSLEDTLVTPRVGTRGGSTMKKKQVTLKDLETRHSAVSYQRLNRAIRAMKSAGLVSISRGKNNEIQMTEANAMLVNSLVQLMQRDFGIKKAVDFLDAQVARAKLDSYRKRIRKMVKMNPEFEDVFDRAGLLEEDAELSCQEAEQLAKRIPSLV